MKRLGISLIALSLLTLVACGNQQADTSATTQSSSLTTSGNKATVDSSHFVMKDSLTFMQENRSGAPTLSNLVREKVQLVNPPYVHAHTQKATSAQPKVVQFSLPIVEKNLVIDSEGTTINAMTFGGTVPGPLMVVHEGDYVELTLINLTTNTMVHNIDFHASTGALGGGDFTHVAPGEQVVLRWKATKAGTFIYHCAPGGPLIPWHVVQGMEGAIMVLPRDGLKDEKGNSLAYDRVFYVGENDFYVPKDKNGRYKTYPNPSEAMVDEMESMKTLVPSHVVFNGAVGALTGDNGMKANVGETVLIVHSQANRDSRPHLIGGHGDYVWEEGKFNNPPRKDFETWFIRGGSAGAAMYTFQQPGTYVYLNHNLIEAILLGAAAHIHVSGEKWNHDLMTASDAEPIKANTDLSLPIDAPENLR